MYIHTAKKVLNELERIGLEDGQLIINDSRCKTLPFSAGNFHRIYGSSRKMKIAFVDGGNCEILSSSSAAVHFIRIYFNIFSDRKNIESSKIEFYSAVLPSVRNEKIFYRTRLFPLDDSFLDCMPDERDLEFDSMDPTLREGIFMIDISKAASIARRFAEWKIIEKIADRLNEGDAIIRDGSLLTGITNETKYFKSACIKTMEKNIMLGGLVKKSIMLTTTGKNFLSVIKKQGDKIMSKTSWYYNPVCSINLGTSEAEIFIVKLHPYADFVFRLELLPGNPKELIAHLMENSSDYRFPGYPYGLLEADKNARVSESERKFHKAIFPAFRDAHDILDSAFK